MPVALFIEALAAEQGVGSFYRGLVACHRQAGRILDAGEVLVRGLEISRALGDVEWEAELEALRRDLSRGRDARPRLRVSDIGAQRSARSCRRHFLTARALPVPTTYRLHFV